MRAGLSSGVGCGLCIAGTGRTVILIPSNDRALKDFKTIRLLIGFAFHVCAKLRGAGSTGNR
jgi:hypothetical protein